MQGGECEVLCEQLKIITNKRPVKPTWEVICRGLEESFQTLNSCWTVRKKLDRDHMPEPLCPSCFIVKESYLRRVFFAAYIAVIKIHFCVQLYKASFINVRVLYGFACIFISYTHLLSINKCDEISYTKL